MPLRDIQPDIVAPKGQKVTLDASGSVYAESGSTYQWYVDTMVEAYQKIEGATSPQYQFTASQVQNYKCVITHPDGTHHYEVHCRVQIESK